MAKVRSKKQSKVLSSPFKNYWTRNNYIIFAIGLGIILIGFVLMNQAPWNNTLSLSVSPIVLLVAYLIVIPFSILYKKNKNVVEENVSSKD